MKNADQIAERVAAKMVARGQWEWEIFEVNRDGTALFQLVYEIGARFIKLSELTKVAGDLSDKAKLDMAHVATKGLPVNLAQMRIGEAEVVFEDGRLRVFANVHLRWNPGVENLIWDDVQEMMKDAGLI